MITAPPTTADPTSRPQTVSTVIIPIKLKPGLNVYHPKPIPPPEMLPLTRMVGYCTLVKINIIFAYEYKIMNVF